MAVFWSLMVVAPCVVPWLGEILHLRRLTMDGRDWSCMDVYATRQNCAHVYWAFKPWGLCLCLPKDAMLDYVMLLCKSRAYACVQLIGFIQMQMAS